MHDPEKIPAEDMPVLLLPHRNIARVPMIIWGITSAIVVVLIIAFDLTEDEVITLSVIAVVITLASAWLYWSKLNGDYTEQERAQKRRSRARKRRERVWRRKKK